MAKDNDTWDQLGRIIYCVFDGLVVFIVTGVASDCICEHIRRGVGMDSLFGGLLMLFVCAVIRFFMIHILIMASGTLFPIGKKTAVIHCCGVVMGIIYNCVEILPLYFDPMLIRIPLFFVDLMAAVPTMIYTLCKWFNKEFPVKLIPSFLRKLDKKLGIFG